ncbi:MAG: hypothetical protein PSV46_09075 [Reyranella sp.]|nr:hypothetical protein [Reyranella sp.]
MTQEPSPDPSLVEAVRTQAGASRKLAAEAKQRLDEVDVDLPSALNELFEGRLGPFRTDAGEILSSDGSVRIGPFAVVIYAGGNRGSSMSIDGVAGVIDAYEDLTLENLRTAYGRARQVKALTKKAVQGSGVADPTSIAMTLAIVFARRSSFSLDEISDEMSRLNLTMPAHAWPDMVAIDGKGVVNYATRVPGEDKLGDFILPVADHSPSGLAAPLHIYKVIRSAGRHTFNKVAALVAARVAIFAPGTVLDKFDTELDELSPNGVVNDAHQFNLRGELRLLSEADVVDEMLPTDVYGIVAGKKEVGSIRPTKYRPALSSVARFQSRGAFRARTRVSTGRSSVNTRPRARSWRRPMMDTGRRSRVTPLSTNSSPPTRVHHF